MQWFTIITQNKTRSHQLGVKDKTKIKLEGFYINFTNKKVENEHELDDIIVQIKHDTNQA